MANRILFIDEDEIDQIVITMQRRPRIFHQRVNYMEVYDDQDFMDRFRLSKSSFNTVFTLIEKEIAPLSERNREIPGKSKLYMTLRYLATGSILLTVADFAGVSKTLAVQYIHQVCRAIAKQRPRFVSFPSTVAHTRKVVKGFYDRSKFPRVIGALDCSHIRIQGPGDNTWITHNNSEVFRNRKGYFSINVQCICDPWLKIMNIVARWPGSCHNQIIFDNSVIKNKFETGVIKGYLLGDSGYEVKPYLMCPLLNPTTRAQQLYNESHIRTRNVIERCFAVIKRRFPVLSKGIACDWINTQAIIVACAVLHNICINMKDDLPNDNYNDENDYNDVNDDNVEEDLADVLTGRQERDALIRDHFANRIII